MSPTILELARHQGRWVPEEGQGWRPELVGSAPKMNQAAALEAPYHQGALGTEAFWVLAQFPDLDQGR